MQIERAGRGRGCWIVGGAFWEERCYWSWGGTMREADSYWSRGGAIVEGAWLSLQGRG